MLSRRSLMQSLVAIAGMAWWPVSRGQAAPARTAKEISRSSSASFPLSNCRCVLQRQPAEDDIYGRSAFVLQDCPCQQLQWDVPGDGDVGPDRSAGPPGPVGHRGPVGPASPEAAIFSQIAEGWLTPEDEAMLQRDYGVVIEPAIRYVLPGVIWFNTPGYSGGQKLIRTMRTVPIVGSVEGTVAALREATLQGIIASGVRSSQRYVTSPTAFHGYDVGRLSEDKILLVWYEYAGSIYNKLLQQAAPHLKLCDGRLKATLLHHGMSNERDRERYSTDAVFREQVQRLADC